MVVGLVATKHHSNRITHLPQNGDGKRMTLLVESGNPRLTHFVTREYGRQGKPLVHAATPSEAVPVIRGANGQLEGIIISLRPGEKLPDDLLLNIKSGTPITKVYDSPSPEGKLPFYFHAASGEVIGKADDLPSLYRFILNPSSDITSIRNHLEKRELQEWLLVLGHADAVRKLNGMLHPAPGAQWEDGVLRLKACAILFEFLPEKDRLTPYRK